MSTTTRFHGQIRRISVLFLRLFYHYFHIFKAILSFFFFTFIDYKSRMIQIDSFEIHFYIS